MASPAIFIIILNIDPVLHGLMTMILKI